MCFWQVTTEPVIILPLINTSNVLFTYKTLCLASETPLVTALKFTLLFIQLCLHIKLV